MFRLNLGPMRRGFQMEVLTKAMHKQNILLAAAFGLIVTHWPGAAMFCDSHDFTRCECDCRRGTDYCAGGVHLFLPACAHGCLAQALYQHRGRQDVRSRAVRTSAASGSNARY